MNSKDKLAGDMDDPMLREALKNFKTSVDAWSEAAYSRPRALVGGRVSGGGWRVAASWALGCVLVAGGLAAGMYQRHHQQETAKVAADKSAAQRAAQKHAATEWQNATAQEASQQQSAVMLPVTAPSVNNSDEDLLANVASDVSQQVPSAMEPLAQMMDDNGTMETTDKSIK